MQSVFVGGEKPVCFLEVIPKYVRFGSMTSSGSQDTPVIEVCYTPREASSIGPLAHIAQLRGLVPEVFVWDEGGRDLETMVVFKIDAPTHQELSEIFWKSPLKVVLTELETVRVVAESAASLSRGSLQGFTHLREQHPEITLVLTDASSSYTRQGALDNPLLQFTIMSLEHRRPDLMQM